MSLYIYNNNHRSEQLSAVNNFGINKKKLKIKS